jgi:hypothetical protein
MFRIVSRSRRGAKGAGYGWLLVISGTLASIGGNVAHAQPDLVARLIAAAIPLAVLAMLEGLKGDAGELTRLVAAAQVSIPDVQADRSAWTARPPRTPPSTAWTARPARCPASTDRRPGRWPPGQVRLAGSRRGCNRPRPGPAGWWPLDGPDPRGGGRVWPFYCRRVSAHPAGAGRGGAVVKLRLHGTPTRVAEATRRLVQILEVVAVSQPYPDQAASVLVRVYLEVRLPEAPWSTGVSPGGSPDPSREAAQAGRQPHREVGGR